MSLSEPPCGCTETLENLKLSSRPTIAPITVGIPTYRRGDKVLQALRQVMACDPAPAEVMVFLDGGEDAELRQRLRVEFPAAVVFSSPERIGPGGARHRMLQAASQPWFVSLDDDSWPVDADFFAQLNRHMENSEGVAVFAAVIAHRGEPMPAPAEWTQQISDYTGCGHAMRVAAYRTVTGYVERPNAYGMEERDVAMQLHAAGWQVRRCGNLRVFHDTTLGHHRDPELVAATVENAALLAWLRYPVILWPYGLLQYANVVRFMIARGRVKGLLRGLLHTPLELWRHRGLRRPLPSASVWSYLGLRHQPAAS